MQYVKFMFKKQYGVYTMHYIVCVITSIIFIYTHMYVQAFYNAHYIMYLVLYKKTMSTI